MTDKVRDTDIPLPLNEERTNYENSGILVKSLWRTHHVGTMIDTPLHKLLKLK